VFSRLGFWELAIILIIALVIFGPNKLPEMGKALGRGIREFKDAATQLAEDFNADSKDRKDKDTEAEPEGRTEGEKEAKAEGAGSGSGAGAGAADA
jgi:sec-independent protein translocase protein TatA